MKRQRLALFISSFLFIALVNWFGHWATVQAQTPPSTLAPIPIALTAGASSPTYRANLVQSDNPTTRGIVGDDNRIPVVSQKFPWAAIGRIDWVKTNGEEVGSCTGTLINKDLVLTNSHCIGFLDENQQPVLVNMIFKPNLIEGGFVESDKAIATVLDYGWQGGWDNPAEDWALLKLNKPLGEKYGYLGWRELDFASPNTLNALRNQIRVAGYSGDYPTRKQRTKEKLNGLENDTAGVHLGCNIEGSSESLGISLLSDGTGRYGAASGQATSGLIIHDCDTTGGSSGSAILAKFDDDNYYILGIHAGWNKFDSSTIPSTGSQESCRITKRDTEGNVIYDNQNNLAYDDVGICRNRGVRASQWATQAAAMQSAN